MNRIAIIALCVLFSSNGGAVRADDARGGEIGLLVGGAAVDGALVGSGDPELAPTFGIRGGSMFHRRFGWFVDFLTEDVATTLGYGDARTWVGRTGFEWYMNPDSDVRWFLAAAPGWVAVEFDGATVQDFHRPIVSASIGQRFRVARNVRMRWELRGDHSLDDPGIRGEDLDSGRFLLGVSWGPGTGRAARAGRTRHADRSPRPETTPTQPPLFDDRIPPAPRNDGDADGVADRRDRCPGTPFGALVDDGGCPVDTDQDGIADGIDRCVDTPLGGVVGSDGCPPDSDGDGVFDTADVCPSTPSGARVDEWGCARDRDRDGVPDGLDRCAGTLVGAFVDDLGCPSDGDGDGVPDGVDRCPDSGPDQRVAPDGCPREAAGTRRPDDPRAAPPEFIAADDDPVVLEGVTFETASATLTSAAIGRLSLIAEGLLEWPELRVEIGGHTDSTGDDRANLDLSRRRAETVRNFLIGRGVAPGRMTARGYGESRPVATNASAAGRSRNRRVELTRIE